MFKPSRVLGCALLLAGAILTSGAPAPAQAADTLKLAIGQRGNWDTSVTELGRRAGIFEKHGINVEILYTQGGGETQQAVLSNSVDIGVAAGVMGAISAFSKGAPIRIIGAETTGGQDLYWYVRSSSPIKTLKDIDGHTIAYSTNGSSTHGVVNAFVEENSLKARPTATGGPSATLTAVMSGQIDVGWAAPPFGLDLLDRGEIRVIASGSDANAFREQTVRVLATSARVLDTRRDVIDRYLAAYRETVDWMYSDDKALAEYADFVGISVDAARRTRDEFFPRQALDPDRIAGLEVIVPSSVALRYADRELTQEELSQLIQIPPRP